MHTQFTCIRLYPISRNDFSKEMDTGTSKMAFVFSVPDLLLYISGILHVLPWPVPSSPYPTIKISTAMPNTFGISLNISFIFLWNMTPAEAAPNGNLVYLYLPN